MRQPEENDVCFHLSGGGVCSESRGQHTCFGWAVESTACHHRRGYPLRGTIPPGRDRHDTAANGIVGQDAQPTRRYGTASVPVWCPPNWGPAGLYPACVEGVLSGWKLKARHGALSPAPDPAEAGSGAGRPTRIIGVQPPQPDSEKDQGDSDIRVRNEERESAGGARSTCGPAVHGPAAGPPGDRLRV